MSDFATIINGEKVKNMATNKEFFTYFSECIFEIEGITFRKMMGEYLIYKNGELIGGLYDNRFLVKCSEKSDKFLHNATRVLPYKDAKKEMYEVADFEDKEYIKNLFLNL